MFYVYADQISMLSNLSLPLSISLGRVMVPSLMRHNPGVGTSFFRGAWGLECCPVNRPRLLAGLHFDIAHPGARCLTPRRFGTGGRTRPQVFWRLSARPGLSMTNRELCDDEVGDHYAIKLCQRVFSPVEVSWIYQYCLVAAMLGRYLRYFRI